MLSAELTGRLTETLGTPRELRPVAGGDINAAAAWTSASGARYFIKTNPALGAAAFAAEADGLSRLGATGVVRVPAVVAHGAVGGQGYLVLRWIESAPATPQAWRALGASLAALHAVTNPAYGLPSDNFIGRLPQSNRLCENWADFWAEERIGAQVRLARAAGRLPKALEQQIERLCSSAGKICARPGLRPSLLHGDLWSGNVMFTQEGPVLIDPAVYFGDREVEIAFTELFGGFAPAFAEAYRAAAPLDEGYAGRRGFWQLYPLLVHLNMFGHSYLAGVERAVRSAEELL